MNSMGGNTWESIVEPEKPIHFSELEVKVAEGEELILASRRPELYNKVLDYWNQQQVNATLARADELADALARKDENRISRMSRQIGGVNQKYRLSRAFLEGGTLHLALSGTNYMDFIGTNVQAINDSQFRERLMNAGIDDYADPNHYFASPLGVCAVVYVFSDRKREKSSVYVPIGWRSDKVMIYPNVPHVFGGFLDVDGKKLSIDGHLRKELREEMGLSEEEMGGGSFYGIIRHRPSRHPEAIGGIPIYLSQEELEQSWKKNAPGKFEHRNISFYKVEELAGFLEEYGEKMVPSGAAALTKFLEFFNEL